MDSPDLGVDLQDLLILTFNGKQWVQSHSNWDNISKIAQNSACDTFPGSRSYLMKRFHFFFGDVLRDWLLKQDVWLTIFFISKQLLVKSLHDQDQIWWKVWNFSSETFLVKVDLSKVVKLAWTFLTLAWIYQNELSCFLLSPMVEICPSFNYSHEKDSKALNQGWIVVWSR